jgi:hypothetical protein
MDEGHVRPVFNQEALFLVRILYIFTFQEPRVIRSFSRYRGSRVRQESCCLRRESRSSPKAGILWLTGWLTLTPDVRD